MSKRRDLLVAVVALLVVLAVLVLGFRRLGPPRSHRAINADVRRVEDLRAIARQICARQESQLPVTHGELKPGHRMNLKDPVTGAYYEYHPKSATAYELCATFATDSAGEDEGYSPVSPFWSHPAGRRCYQLDSSKTAPW
jgi:hypothetical protein